ncbi:glycosyltransferase family 2 protein [Gramella sp. AN32]|uniref:Glycosyltransferase family 2 protein n=1 Tax=Christiangramia antarctica TaxID=2058158 RepID=A0ABW5X2U0_9FLAO|nr:glycosyltransferase family 2 protein [Gramella sp. AN32]MCM4154963.1 hypothetical protein [Gramella sp. AN32]
MFDKLSKKSGLVILLLSILLLTLFFPKLLWALLLFTVVLMIFLAFLRLWYASNSTQFPEIKVFQKTQPFVSIHIAICNEPSELVLNNLKHCLQIEYPNYEVIVLDNNTKSKALWKPVQQFCKRNSQLFKFKHYDQLDGFKAGALNKCLELSHPDTEFILTIDADYCVDSKCIQIALEEISSKNFALIQFPQCYNSNIERNGILNELEHFFQYYATGGNYTCSTLPTGTLSFINAKALKRASGWPEKTLTEDARLGLEFLSLNLPTKFSPRCIGKGEMPGSVNDLIKQRNRWVYGNTQCLLDLFKLKMPIKKKLSAFVQLSAWINMLSIPLLFSILYIVLFFFGKSENFNFIPKFTAIQFAVFIAGKLLLFLLKSSNNNSANLCKTLLIHMALAFESSTAVWQALSGKRKSFIRTNKFNSGSSFADIPLQFPFLLLGLSLLQLYQNEYITSIILAVLAILFLASGIFLFYEFRLKIQKRPTLKISLYENSFDRA